MKNLNLKNFILLIIIFLLGIVTSGCETTYDTMLDEFNTAFTNANAVKEMKPSSVFDETFDPTRMLSQEQYMIPEGFNLVFQAPEGAVKVAWTATVPVAGETGVSKDYLLGTGRVLSYQMPGVFRQTVENFLTLTITTAAGVEYSDRAKIITYSKYAY